MNNDTTKKLKEAMHVAKTATLIIEENIKNVMNDIEEEYKPGWICPKCGSKKLLVTRNDPKKTGKACLECAYTFKTMEIVVNEDR